MGKNEENTSASESNLLFNGEVIKLEEILSDSLPPPLDYATFRQKLISQFLVEENIYFVEKFRYLESLEAKHISPGHVKRLNADFIASGGKYELNLTSSCRNEIMDDLETLAMEEQVDVADYIEALKPAFKHVCMMLKSDILPKYFGLVKVKSRSELNSLRKSQDELKAASVKKANDTLAHSSLQSMHSMSLK